MALEVVGAGLGRTGTHSLKLALEQLLGGPCYHMYEVMQHPDDIAVWQAAADGEAVDWHALFADYKAAVDWPEASFWREVADAYPDALVLLSVRPADKWWESANNTIWKVAQREAPEEFPPMMKDQMRMVRTLLSKRFCENPFDEAEAKAAYERHNAEVRASVPADRLLVWEPGDGWEPICHALGRPVPDTPFPHVNTTTEFQAMLGLDGST
jgi:hypothetical protein